MNITIFGLLWCVMFCISHTHPISIKIVRETNALSPNFNHNDFNTKSQASNFTGPPQLLYLVGKCFTYSSEKYEYRVCPFDNVTQHEKVWHSGAYNGVIGVWKEWTIKNNSFDSLVFTDGDDCEDGVNRSAQIIWVCDRTATQNIDKVIDIKEPKKCFYEIFFASDFGCGDDDADADADARYIYTHLSDQFKLKWDQIETNYFYKELTQLGYESALRELFIESKIIRNTSHEDIKEINFDSKEKCLKQFILLKEQNVRLEQRIEFLEKELNKKV